MEIVSDAACSGMFCLIFFCCHTDDSRVHVHQVEISKQDVGFDIDKLELASRLALTEVSDQQQVVSAERGDKESSDSSDSDTFTDDSDDESSSSSDSFVTASSPESDADDRCSLGDERNTPLTDGLASLVIETDYAAAADGAAIDDVDDGGSDGVSGDGATVDPTEAVYQQLASLTVSDEHQLTPSMSPPPQSHDDTPVQQ